MSGHSRSLMEPTPEERAALDAIDRGVTCPECDGTGTNKSPGGMKRWCQRCNGSGWVAVEPDTSRLLTAENELNEARSMQVRLSIDLRQAAALSTKIEEHLFRVEAAHRTDMEETPTPRCVVLIDAMQDATNEYGLHYVLALLRDICEHKQAESPALGTLGGEPLFVASAWAHATASLAQMAEEARKDGL